MKNEVLIRITGEQTGDSYLAKSYPDNDYDNDGWGGYMLFPFITLILSILALHLLSADGNA